MDFSEMGGEVVEGAEVLRVVEEDFEDCEASLEEMLVGDGFEDVAESAGAGTLFADSSRTFSNILEASGFVGGFGGAFEASGVDCLDSVFEDGGGVGAEGFEAAFAVGGVIVAGFDKVGAIGVFLVAVAVAVGFIALGAAFVDFALFVDFFSSGISSSTGSEMIFLGLPLFLTTSADMLDNELVPGRCLLRKWT
jgi:hypothetical protein